MVEHSLVDLHLHHALPLAGSWWRRRIQGLSLPGIDPGGETGARLHGLAMYQTFAIGRRGARDRLFRSLEELRRLPLRIILRRGDIGSGDAYVLGVESLRFLDDPADLDRLWGLGVRFLQPVHFLDNLWGRSSREGLWPPSAKGLTGLGRELVAEMMRLGFILDLAHMNRRTAEDCLSAFPGPVMCSHTGHFDQRPNARNIPSDQASEIFRRGGAVGVTCWRRLLGPWEGGRKGGSPRALWTRSFCEAVLGLSALHPGSRICIGSDRGAPILAPGWFFTPGHLDEIAACLEEGGWGKARISGFLRGNALAFYGTSLPT